LGRGIKAEEELARDIKVLFTKSVSFPGKQNSQVHMEIHYLHTHMLNMECFAG